MLVLSRLVGQKLIVCLSTGERLEIKVTGFRDTEHGQAVRFGLTAPTSVIINREEIQRAIDAALDRLDAYRKVFPIGVPIHLHWRAAVLERRGQTRAALRARERAHAAALRLGMTLA